jgi:Arc/MetJ family transcription regulator
MKTTIEIADALLEAARRRASERGTTLRALVEEGLRSVLEGEKRASSFTLRDASVAGRGLRTDVREGGWEQIVARAYEGHGG